MAIEAEIEDGHEAVNTNPERSLAREASGLRRKQGVFGNAVWSLSAEGFRMIGATVTFLILTKLYEPTEFGVLIATMELFGFMAPLAGVGAGWVALRRVATEGWDPAYALARATGITLAGSVVLGAVLVLARPLILPQASLWLFLGIGLSEMFLLGMVEVTLFIAQAGESLIAKAMVWGSYGMARAAAALTISFTFDSPGLGPWVVANIGIGLLVLLVAEFATVGRLVRPVRPKVSDVGTGVVYSLSGSADRVRHVTPIVTLASVGSSADSGLYAAGRRLLNVAQTSLFAGLHAANAMIWRAGAESTRAARKVAVRLTGIGVGYGLLVGASIWLLGEFVVSFLGDSYGETADVLRWMSLFPALLAFEMFAAVALTAAGYQNQRLLLTAATGVMNLGLNLTLIPSHGWKGAIYANLASSFVQGVGLWSLLGWASTKAPRITKEIVL